MSDHPIVAPVEFSRPELVLDLEPEGRRVSIAADDAERAALAARFGLNGLDGLEADLILTPMRKGRAVRVEGEWRAVVRQTCVVTLAPLVDRLSETVTQVFAEDAETDSGEEIDIDAEEQDLPDLLVGNTIDLGELVAEQLALAIDPFPRADGAEFTPPQGAETAAKGDGGEEKTSPFSVLAALKKKDG